MLLAAVLAMAAAPTAAPARGILQTGIADDGAILGNSRAADDTAAAWAKLGVDVARVQVSWARVAPKPNDPLIPPTFDPANDQDPPTTGTRTTPRAHP